MTVTPLQVYNNRYKVVTILNHGSFGVVSLAKDSWNKNALVALKCIHHVQDAPFDEAKEEIAVHKLLGSHQYIAPLLDHFEADNSTFLVMEYYPDGDLYEAIRADKGPSDSSSVLNFMLQLIDAVKYAHSKGVYHRDIKPENILIAADGSVRLADWGLSTTVRKNTEFGVGSERYMAPELFDRDNIDYYDAEKADIWSIGICLFNILFARNPFTIASQKDKLFLDFAANRESLFDIFPTLSCDTFAALRHALTIDPDNRSLESMRNELCNVNVWTTDEEYYDDFEHEGDEYETEYDDDYETEYDDDSESNTDVSSVSTTALCSAIVPTTVNREPLRTPSILSCQINNNFQNLEWDRTMQFTPPNPSFFDKSHEKFVKKHGASRLSQVISKQSSLLMESVSEEEDEVFAMDGLGSSMIPIESPPVDVRAESPSQASSMSSVPSLVPSTTSSQTFSSGAGSATSKSRGFSDGVSPSSVYAGYSIPSAASVSVGPMQAGKSWSDLIFDDEDDFDEDELIKALSSMPKLSFANGANANATTATASTTTLNNNNNNNTSIKINKKADLCMKTNPQQPPTIADGSIDDWVLSNWDA